LSHHQTAFALRRAALGIVKIVLEKKLPLSLTLAVGQALKILLAHAPKKAVTREQETQILDFLRDRARYVFREKDGFEYDEVNAVFRTGADDLVDARKRLEALRAIRKSRNFEPLTVSFKRIRKIVEKAGKQAEGVFVQSDLFEGDVERALFAAMRKAAPKVEEQKRAGRYKEALEVIASLRPDIDRFFEQVMVMAENEAVKKNRLALLSELLREFSTIADFSELGGEGKN